MQILLLLLLIPFICVFLLFLVGNLHTQWQDHRKKQMPICEAVAMVVDKEKREVASSRFRHFMNTRFWEYWVTFEMGEKEKVVLLVPSSHFGFLQIGTKGKLRYQGIHFLEFTREKM